MTTIMTHYFHNQIPYNIDIEEANCRSCQTPTLYLDHAQGDTVCTSCGLVHSQHYRSSIPEWRDYSAIDPESAGRNGTARAGSVIDESRWAGGLEPTSLGRVYNPSSSAEYNTSNLQGYRRNLGKVKRHVDKWVEKEFERQVEAGKVALIIREKKIKAENDKDNNEEHDHEDWTGYGTNEHEQLARLRLEEMDVANRLLISEKWSLDRALLLHGESHEIPAQYTSYNPLTGEQPKDVSHEREIMNMRMDSSQRKASADLYCIYKMVQKALQKLDLCENIILSNDVTSVICRYANKKGCFKVKGVAPRPSNEVRNNAILHEQQSEYIKLRQMAALSSAAIYMECKKNRLGRTVPDICSSFDLPPNCNNQKFKQEAFIKPKHLSRAINEFKSLLPEYIKSVHESANLATVSASSSTTTQTDIANQVEHITKKLKLSPTASKAITKLVLHCKDEKLSSIGGTKNTVLIGSVIYMICDAATAMQRLSKTALEKDLKKKKDMDIKMEEESTIVKIEDEEKTTETGSISSSSQNSTKRKHIRPGGSLGLKKQRLGGIFDAPIPVVSLSSSENESYPNDTPSAMQSYYQWSLEKSWNRSVKQIEASCNASAQVICEFYRKNIYPKRKEYLAFLQDFSSDITSSESIYENKATVLFSNFVSVAPLMVPAKK